MKKFLLTISSIILTFGVYAQTDSTNKKMFPPDIKNTKDGINQNNNQNRDNNQQNPGMNQNNNQDHNNHQPNPGMNQNNRSKQNNQNQSDSTANDRKMKNYADGLVMKDGKMWLVKYKKMTMLVNTMTMENGTSVMSDGSYMKKDGSRMMFREGEHMDMMGKITPNK